MLQEAFGPIQGCPRTRRGRKEGVSKNWVPAARNALLLTTGHHRPPRLCTRRWPPTGSMPQSDRDDRRVARPTAARGGHPRCCTRGPFYAQEKAELEHLLHQEAAAHREVELYLLRPPIVLGPTAGQGGAARVVMSLVRHGRCRPTDACRFVSRLCAGPPVTIPKTISRTSRA